MHIDSGTVASRHISNSFTCHFSVTSQQSWPFASKRYVCFLHLMPMFYIGNKNVKSYHTTSTSMAQPKAGSNKQHCLAVLHVQLCNWQILYQHLSFRYQLQHICINVPTCTLFLFCLPTAYNQQRSAMQRNPQSNITEQTKKRSVVLST